MGYEDKMKLKRIKISNKHFETKKKEAFNLIAEFKPKYENLESILKKIPNFKFNFTENQLKMMTSTSKAIISCGRSGTGKSSCALLRMIGIDLMYIATQKLKSGKKKISSEDIKPTGIRSVFITANHVLSKELKSFYDKIISEVKNKFKSKSKNVAELVNTATDMIGVTDDLFNNQILSSLKNGSLEELEKLILSKNFGSDNYTLPDNLKLASKEDFPMFCTLVEFFTMINNSLRSEL